LKGDPCHTTRNEQQVSTSISKHEEGQQSNRIFGHSQSSRDRTQHTNSNSQTRRKTAAPEKSQTTTVRTIAKAKES
jgi:hypothetical protein